jgi:pyruvate/2-oxoglutarate dehydrogenase complex dihydrolipoamide dehydrogenase (E3) component
VTHLLLEVTSIIPLMPRTTTPLLLLFPAQSKSDSTSAVEADQSRVIFRRRPKMTQVVVLGAGPAGVLAALRAADLGARTALVTSGAFGGMAANDGPVPVRTLAHAGRLMREARQLGQYGVKVSEPVLDYSRLLARVREVVSEVDTHSSLRRQIDEFGVALHEQAGAARFLDPHTISIRTR